MIVRVVHVWGKTVLGDKKFSSGTVSVGSDRKCDFMVGEGYELPRRLPFLQFSRKRGWEVTLGPGMGGELHIAGKPADVRSAFMEGILVDGGFRVVGAKLDDWGFVRLAGSEHSFFFHVTTEAQQVPGGRHRDTGILWQAALFALAFHAIFLGVAWLFRSGPISERPTLGGYIVNISHTYPPPPPKKQKGEKNGAMVKPRSTVGEEGKTGEAKKNDKKDQPTPAQAQRTDKLNKIGKGTVLDVANRTSIESMIANGPDMGKIDKGLQAMAGGGNGRTAGAGGGSGYGTSTRGGSGTGGGGTNPYAVVTDSPIQTGGTRAAQGLPTGAPSEAQVAFTPGTPDGDFGGLTPEQVQKTVERNQRTLKYCFEKVLQRDAKVSGKVVLYWRIEANGKVSTTKVKSSTVNNPDMEDCLARQVSKWRFDQAANGQVTDVKYPFVFSGQ